VVVIVCALATTVSAEPAQREPTEYIPPSHWLFDAEALAFIWFPAAGAIYADSVATARSTPLFFDASEGGKTSSRKYEVPIVSLTIGGAGIIGAMMLGSDDPSRFYHAKGMTESLATSAFVTSTAKLVFGRHRPDYDPMVVDLDSNRSFPSGHSTRAFSALTYPALYLHYHVFDRWRAPGSTLPWWEAATYGGIGAFAVFLAGERVRRNRHNISDVVAGSIVGFTSSVAFFYWHERQYRRARQKTRESRTFELLGTHSSRANRALPDF
jgi:membrane-associated phospholipid phosphatase